MSDSESDCDLSNTRALLPVHHKPINRRQEAEELWTSYKGAPDRLLETIYQYYRGGGYKALVLARTCNLLILAFLHFFLLYTIYGIDWHTIMERKDGIVEFWEISCLSVWCVARKMSFWAWILTLLVTMGWWWAAAQLWIVDQPKWKQVRCIYRHLLDFRDRQLTRIDFDEVMKRVVSINKSQKLELLKGLDEVKICARVMRRENYLIALFNRGLLQFKLSEEEKARITIPLSKPLEWALNFTVLSYVFDDKFTVQRRFLGVRSADKQLLAEGLKRRARLVGIVSLLTAPLAFFLTLCYLIFRYGEEMYQNPQSIASRQYTLSARWLFREYNELPHYFEGRLAATHRKAGKYVDQFPNARTSAIARLISFVAGSVALILVIVGILNDDMLIRLHLPFGKSMLWYLGILGAVLAVSRGLRPGSRDDPGRLLGQVVEYLHYRPSNWTELSSGRCHSDFCKLYPYKLKVLLDDLLGTLLTPLVLLFMLPAKAESLIDFFREFTAHVEGLGYVCSFSIFDFSKTNISGTSDTLGTSKLNMSMMSFAGRHFAEQPAVVISSATSDDQESNGNSTMEQSVFTRFYNK